MSETHQNSNPNAQITSFCENLALHSRIVSRLLDHHEPANIPVLQGHLEAHQEKIETSIRNLETTFSIDRNYRLMKWQNSSGAYEESTALGSREILKVLLKNIRRLETQMGKLIKTSPTEHFKSLHRQLSNDRVRTAYMLQ